MEFEELPLLHLLPMTLFYLCFCVLVLEELPQPLLHLLPLPLAFFSWSWRRSSCRFFICCCRWRFLFSHWSQLGWLGRPLWFLVLNWRRWSRRLR